MAFDDYKDLGHSLRWLAQWHTFIKFQDGGIIRLLCGYCHGWQSLTKNIYNEEDYALELLMVLIINY